jgi:uridine kinase
MMKFIVVSCKDLIRFFNRFYSILAHYKVRSNDHQQIEKSAKYTDLFVCPVNRSFLYIDNYY